MNRRTAFAIVIPAALSALTLTVFLSVSVPVPVPVAAPVPVPAPVAAPAPAPVAAPAPVCIRGAGAAASALGTSVIVDGRLDVARLADVSRRAFALERARERVADGPAWPQRMGLDAAGRAVAPPPACVSLAP